MGRRRRVTVRERIRDMQRVLIDGKPPASIAREYLVSLTALSGNVADAVRTSEAEYRKVLLDALDREKKANRAKMHAESTDEYARYREAKDLMELVKQLIVSCRAYLRSMDEEARLAR